MTDDPKERKRAARQERLQAALRENLRRRKAQARGRGMPDQAAEPSEEQAPGAATGGVAER